MFTYLFFTAPLSKSLEPLAPPQITLLAADGTPIARKGAVVEAPVEEKDVVGPLVIDIMRNAVQLDVPLEVNVAWGKNWADAKA